MIIDSLATFPPLSTARKAKPAPRRDQSRQRYPAMAALQVLEAVWRTRGVTAAARELGISHAAVSMQLDRIQQRFSTPLMRRGDGKVDVTPEGQIIAEAYLAAAAILERAVTRVEDVVPSCFTVSLPRSLGHVWLRGLDSLEVAVTGGAIATHADGATPDWNDCDVAVVDEPLQPALFAQQLLFEERIVAVCTPQYALRHDLFAATGTALLADLILIEDDAIAAKSWREAQAGECGEPARHIRLSGRGLALEAALRGQGLALVCAVAAADALADGRLCVPFGGSIASGRSWSAAWPLDALNRGDAQKAMAWLHAEIVGVQLTCLDHTRLADPGALAL